MNNNYAVVDIGTLKVKCLVVSVSSNGEISEKYSSNTLTCFGSHLVANNGFILEENLVRTITELERCKAILKKYDVGKLKVVSTHAMRRAKNKNEIVERIKKEIGFDVENISQEEEAELFFNAVMRDFPNKEDYVVLDVGGGSVQVLLGNSLRLRDVHTMRSGAQYLHDNFTKMPSDPESFTTAKDIEKMKEHILKQLLPFEREKGAPIIYGSSNIIDLMKEIGLPLDPNEGSSLHPYRTYSEHLEKFIRKMLPLPYSKREKMFNFQEGYMWGVDKAFLNVVTVAEQLGSPYIIPTNANVARGIIYTLMHK